MYIGTTLRMYHFVPNSHGHQVQWWTFIFKIKMHKEHAPHDHDKWVTHLTLIEYDILRDTGIDDLIAEFARRNGRKVSGLYALT